MWRKENPCKLLLGMQVSSHIRKQYEVFSKKLKIELHMTQPTYYPVYAQ